MKCKSISYVPDDSPYGIKDTKEITAKKLLVYFMETFDPLAKLMSDSETLQALHKLLVAGKKKGLTCHEQNVLESLPWEICLCFSQFLSECPHVHVTID